MSVQEAIAGLRLGSVRSPSRAVLIRPCAIRAGIFGSRWPASIAANICRPETPKMLLATEVSLICASSSSFSTRCFSAVRSRIRLRR
jgi:hypothetical protein